MLSRNLAQMARLYRHAPKLCPRCRPFRGGHGDSYSVYLAFGRCTPKQADFDTMLMPKL